MRSFRWPGIVILALWQVMGARVGALWGELPAVMATHFNGRGRADGWMSRSGFLLVWYGIQLGLVLPFATMPVWLRRLPAELINLPNRDHWLAPSRRDQTMDRLARWSAWFLAGVTALMAGALELVLRANLLRSPQLSPAHAWLLGAFLLFVAAMLVWLLLQFRRPAG